MTASAVTSRVAALLLVPGLALSALVPFTAAQAQNVSLAGRMGQRALLLIDGQPRTMALGQTADGVKLLMLDGESATVVVQGQRLNLRMGAQPASVGVAAAAAPGASGSLARSGRSTALQKA